MRARLVVYAVIVIGIVGGVLLVVWNEPVIERRSTSPERLPSERPHWSFNSELHTEANAGFRVEAGRTDNQPLAGCTGTSNWPQFNGALRDNRSSDTGLLPEWPGEGPPLAWVAFGLGSGFSSVAVVDGVVYTLGNKGESEAMMALDLGTGEKLWCTPFAWASHPSAGDGPRSTPSVGPDVVIGLGASGDLVCVERASGAIRWQMNVVQQFGGISPTWGVSESALIDGDRLIVTPGGDRATLAAIELETGRILWESLVNQPSRAGYSSTIVAEVAQIRHYVQLTAEGTIGVRADTGHLLWRESSASNPSSNCCSPLVWNEYVYCSSSDGVGGALVRLTPRGSALVAELVYHTRALKCHHGDMVIANGLLFGSDDAGVLMCLDLMTGDVQWKHRSVGKGAVTFADGMIYVRGEGGSIALVEATAAGYNELGRFDQHHRSDSSAWAHPVVSAKRLFLRDQDALLCYDLTVRQP